MIGILPSTSENPEKDPVQTTHFTGRMRYYELMDFFTQFKIMYGDPEEDDPEAEVP